MTIPVEDGTVDPGTGAAAEFTAADAKRLADLEVLVKTQADTLTSIQGESERSQLTVKRLQAERDRLQGRLDQPPKAPAAGGRADPTADLRDFANDKAREVMLLRALNAAGLKEEDLPQGIDFTTPAELNNVVQIALLNKQIAAQDQRLTELTDLQTQISELQQQPLSGRSSSVTPDTGGPTSHAPAKKGLTPDEMRKQAADLKKKGDPVSLQHARWLALQANYRDSSKIIGRAHGGPTEEG